MDLLWELKGNLRPHYLPSAPARLLLVLSLPYSISAAEEEAWDCIASRKDVLLHKMPLLFSGSQGGDQYQHPENLLCWHLFWELTKQYKSWHNWSSMKISYGVVETTSPHITWWEKLENASESQPALSYLEESDKNKRGLKESAIALGATPAVFLLLQVSRFPRAATC